MDVGSSMLVPLKEWNVPQAVLLLLATVAAILEGITEYVVAAEEGFRAGTRTAVSVSEPLGPFGLRLVRVSPLRGAVGGQVWRQARSALPTTRSSFRSRSSA